MQIGSFRFNRNELAGSLGDLGTLIPLLVGLVAICGVNPGSALLVVGLLYVVSGSYYRIPIPVQPLKAMAAIAIAMRMDTEIIAAGALLIGIILLILSFTNLIGLVSKIFSRSVVRGIQLGLGLILMKRALILVFDSHKTLSGVVLSLGVGNLEIPLSILVGIIGFVLLLLFGSHKRFPGSILIVLFGIAVGLFFSFDSLNGIKLGYGLSAIKIPSFKNLQYALFLLVIPQLPLTIGNAIVATEDTAAKYFGKKARRVSIRTLPLTMGVANIMASFVGGFPVCHGSGGLTAHYKWGARTGGSNIIIGSACILSALLFGKAVIAVFGIFPTSLLGVLLFYVGVHHSLLIRDLRGAFEISIAVFIAAMAVITSNLAIGFILGIIVKELLELRGYLRRAPVPSLKKIADNVGPGRSALTSVSRISRSEER